MQMLSLLILGLGCTGCENEGSLKAVHFTSRKQVRYMSKTPQQKRFSTEGSPKLRPNKCMTLVKEHVYVLNMSM